MTVSLLFIVLGITFLYCGAEGLVQGSSSLACRLRVTPLVIGLTIVAYGTSMPEFVVSTQTALSHQGDIAIGNVVGSNIFNIAVILGLSALVSPLKVKTQLVRIDAPIMIMAAVWFLFIYRDFHISRLEGALFFSGIILYTVGSFYLARRESVKVLEGKVDIGVPRLFKTVWIDIVFIIGGLAILIIGSKVFVEGSVRFAHLMGASEAFIGLTIVAAGTSMPELATSVVASMRKEADIAIGNIIGSNIFNILCILGAASLLCPLDGVGVRMVNVYVMIGTSVALLPLLWTGFVLAWWEGLILLTIYGGYLYYLFQNM